MYNFTIIDQQDLDGDGNIDYWKTLNDLDGDGYYETIKESLDTNHIGQIDTEVLYMDLSGNDQIDTVIKNYDYNNDNIFDSQTIYKDTDGNGIFDKVTKYYDSDGDGEIDTVETFYDFDEDGKVDYADSFEIDPNTGEPIIDWTLDYSTIDSLEHFEPADNYPQDISGDPVASMELWEYQGNTNRCAIYSQIFVIEEFTGQQIDVEEFVDNAKSQGWFTEDGTTFLNMNKMLDAYGIENEMGFHKDIDDIEQCLNEGGRVIVSIDASEIWFGQEHNLFCPTSSANHAVEVIGIDRTDPDHPMVILNDSGHPGGCGEKIPLDEFIDCWEDGDCQMIACYPNK